MFRAILCIAVFLGCTLPAGAQAEPRSMRAVRASEAPRLDGLLDEPCWQDALPAKGFICNSPRPGIPMPFETEVRIVYTDESLYIGVICYDPAPDSILTQLAGRDGNGNSDYFGITVNSYRDGITGYSFAVTPAGEQWDARLTGGKDEDVTWNAVWDCHTRITGEGWIAEFKIPYYALRFPDAEEQYWDINFFREIRRIRTKGFWNEFQPNGPPYLTQMGIVDGIRGIIPPRRLFFFPYLSGYVNHEQKAEGPDVTTLSYNGGLDMKLGLNDAFTLDATLIPDFGQTISDQLILNLTPFEIQFQDNRPFFLEGTELFSRGGIFYSRRIGGLPPGYFGVAGGLQDGERVRTNPAESQLINAMKVSGRNHRGLGLGVFNAVSAHTEAVIETPEGGTRRVTTAPLTNSSVLVVDQNLPNNSYVALTNTNVTRDGGFYDANVTAGEFVLRNRKNAFSLSGNGQISNKFGREELADRNGHRFETAVSKTSGNWLWKVGQWVMTDTYDPNDMGFLQANNSQRYYLWTAYNIYKPFGKFNNLWSALNVHYDRLYRPDAFTGFLADGNVGLTTRKFFSFSLTGSARPVRGYDYFEPRKEGRYFQTFRYAQLGGWISSDYRRRLALDASIYWTDYENPGRLQFNWRVSPRFRVNDHLMVIYVYSHQNHFNDIGYAASDGGEPVFGTRNVISHTNVLTFTYAFNPFMNMNCRIRHYWGYSDYSAFHSLEPGGDLGPTTFSGFASGENGPSAADRSFNSFTVDLFYRWNFRPGSELIFAWKNAIIHESRAEAIPGSLAEDLQLVFGLPQANSVSLRMVYFLDYRVLTGRKGEAITRNSLN
jgi:hypothetical protein